MNIRNFLAHLYLFLFCSLIVFPANSQAAALTPITGVPTKAIEDVLFDATGWLLTFGVAICLVAIIWGGINYVGSLGSQENAQKAKKMITYALLGLLVMGFSYALIVVIDSIFT